jgi:phospholipid transport system substrate-binding protein
MNSAPRHFATALIALAAASIATPAAAEVDASDPGRFVQSLAQTGFGVLKGNRGNARSQFRSLLSRHFAVEAIGDRLIQRWRPTLKPAQYQAYKTAFPNFIVGTYADRLYEYADAAIKVVRVQDQGTNAAVLTQVTRPGARPVNAVWTVTKAGPGYKVTNLTVNGINLAVTQRADFDSYVQRNGFDALVAFMNKRG